MSELLWITSHVRQLLADEWGVWPVRVDADGDMPFRHGTAACWVSVLDSDPPMVSVFAHAACGVKSSAKLLRMLNDTSAKALSARIIWDSGHVVVTQAVNPIGLTQPVLAQALHAVGAIADDIGPLVAALFDGQTPFPAESDLDEDVPRELG